MGWRDFCVGGVSGALLSIARPPAGITLEEWMSPSSERQALWRAGALIVIAVGLISQRPRRVDARFPATEIALGAAAGFALHGLVLVDLFSNSPAAWMIALALGLCAMLVLRAKPPSEAVDEEAAQTSFLQRLALALCGAGVALTFAAVNSRLCLFGTGTREDDSIACATALVLFGVATLAFSPLLARRRLAPAWLALGLGGAALLTLPSFQFMADLGVPRTYLEFLRRFQLDSSWRGSLPYDALLAARVFGLPALIAGVAFASLRSESNLGWALLGAALAAVLQLQTNWIDEGFSGTIAEHVAPQAAERAALGVMLASVGVLISAFTGVRGSLKLGGSIALCAVIGFFVARNGDKPAVLPLSPWEKMPPRVEWIREMPEGLLTVELQPGRGRIATLDRRRLTPTAEEVPADELRWRASLGDPRGQDLAIAGVLTPERAIYLRILGTSSIWVMSLWPGVGPELEAAMFAGGSAPEGMKIEHGRGWESSEASRGRGGVICPPVEAASRSLSCLDRSATSGTPWPTVGWLSAHQDIAQLDWGDAVSASCSHIEDLSIGVGSGAGNKLRAGSAARFATLAQLLRPLPERENAARSHAAARLVRGEASPAARAALLLYSTQVTSSPFETRAQRTELNPGALEILGKAGVAADPKGFERELDEFVARTLEGQRNLDGLSTFAQPLADAHPEWPVLQRAAARADWEFLRYSDAARRLEQVVKATPYDLQARLWLTESLLRADESSAALRAAEDLLAIQSDRFDAERLRAIAAARAGDPRAGSWIQTLLRDHKDDGDLAAHAGPGPLPPLSPPLGVPGEEHPPEGH